MAQNGTAAGPSKLLNGKKKSAFKNEIHGGGKRYRCCDTGKLAVANPTYLYDRNYSFDMLILKSAALGNCCFLGIFILGNKNHEKKQS